MRRGLGNESYKGKREVNAANKAGTAGGCVCFFYLFCNEICCYSE